jgi:hypothetical protein
MMKKIITYFSIIMTGGLLVAACNLNDAPEFSNSEAFVSFDKVAISIPEDTTTTSTRLRVPVRLSSLGLASNVTYEVFELPTVTSPTDAGAREGRDYELLNESTVLTFTAEAPVQYIEFDILTHNPEFTGDRSFGIKLTTPGSVKLGKADSVAITILDLNHPLSFILGDFTADANSYWDGPTQWKVSIAKDSVDLTKVWITNPISGGSQAAHPVYGVVNAAKTEIKIPVGQKTAVTADYNYTLTGFYGTDGEDEIPDGESITGTIDPDGTIHFQDWYGCYVYYIDGSEAGWFDLYTAATFTKQ